MGTSRSSTRRLHPSSWKGPPSSGPGLEQPLLGELLPREISRQFSHAHTSSSATASGPRCTPNPAANAYGKPRLHLPGKPNEPVRIHTTTIFPCSPLLRSHRVRHARYPHPRPHVLPNTGHGGPRSVSSRVSIGRQRGVRQERSARACLVWWRSARGMLHERSVLDQLFDLLREKPPVRFRWCEVGGALEGGLRCV